MQTQWSLPNMYYMCSCFCSAVPDYAEMRGNITHTVSTDPITGLSDVTFTYTVTSHWSSLAVVKSVYGQLTKELTSGDTVVDALSRLFTDPISVLVSAVCSTFWRCVVLYESVIVLWLVVYTYVVLVCVCTWVYFVKLCLVCLISFPVSVVSAVNASCVGNCSQDYLPCCVVDTLMGW